MERLTSWVPSIPKRGMVAVVLFLIANVVLFSATSIFGLRFSPKRFLPYLGMESPNSLPRGNTVTYSSGWNTTAARDHLIVNSSIESYPGVNTITERNKKQSTTATFITYFPTNKDTRKSINTLRLNICNMRSVELVICVPISRHNSGGRQTIRETWGSHKVVDSYTIAFAFFIGSPTNGEDPSIQQTINKETASHNDIIQGGFIDSYQNLTLKSIFLLEWVSTHCNQSRFTLKADDDMFINVPLLVRSLQQLSTEHSDKPFVVGSLQHGAPPQRSKTNKWYTSEAQFPGKTFPDYVSGTAYAMTTTAAVAITKVVPLVGFLWLEDIFVTGICVRKARLTLINDGKFTFWTPKATGETFRTMISGHKLTNQQVRKIHTELSKL